MLVKIGRGYLKSGNYTKIGSNLPFIHYTNSSTFAADFVNKTKNYYANG